MSEVNLLNLGSLGYLPILLQENISIMIRQLIYLTLTLFYRFSFYTL